jgi:hypothetical protein
MFHIVFLPHKSGNQFLFNHLDSMFIFPPCASPNLWFSSTQVVVSTERIRVRETLFQPSIVGCDSAGLAEVYVCLSLSLFLFVLPCLSFSLSLSLRRSLVLSHSLCLCLCRSFSLCPCWSVFGIALVHHLSTSASAIVCV